jgi:hypothetical protein
LIDLNGNEVFDNKEIFVLDDEDYGKVDAHVKKRKKDAHIKKREKDKKKGKH